MIAWMLAAWRRPRLVVSGPARPAVALPGVYVGLPELLAYEQCLRQLEYLAQTLPSQSLFAGRQRARRRGQGLDFEALREYLPGDDLRAIDWRVSARRRMPHVRIYNEERDCCHWLIVDQRMSMFFGRRRALRSVVAAQAAALLAWKALGDGDRIGGWVLGDDGCDEIRPRRGRRSLLPLLGRIVERNQALHAGESAPAAAGQLDEALRRLLALAPRNGRVSILSDFAGYGEHTPTLLADLARRNEVFLLPLRELPGPTRSAPMVVSDGALQIEVDMRDRQVRERLAGIAESRLQCLFALREQAGLAVLPLVTTQEVVAQLAQLCVPRLAGARERK